MGIRSLIFLTAVVAYGCSSSSSDAPAPTPPNNNPPPVTPYADFMRGADLSFLPEVEAEGTTFKNDADIQKDVLTILKERGCNTIRLRLWHTPTNAHSALPEVVAMATRVKAAGLKVYLDIHYSDTWADPGHQATPAAWQGLSLSDLKDSVYLYTKKVIAAVQPNYVQIGNEVNGGMLWETGRIAQLGNFIALLKEGCRAVREVAPSAKILIHFAGTSSADWFFTQLKTNSVDYDLMAISYYPMWHGFSLTDLKTQIDGLIAANNKPLLIAETAYPFTLGYNDFTNNILGNSSQLIPAYPATPEGQKNFLLAIKALLKQNSKGAGFCYWGAEWVAFRGPTATNGSTAENMALFSFINKELPATAVFADP
ncbi:MAG: glycosyl hydrolase 53 family protein [Cyclobacteriaceae bacterium]|nr:glycosyl hydrolase 53 family protein [Cyclobacteriaceae bacterium]